MKYILIAIIFFSCHTGPNRNTVKFSTEVMDTIKTSPAKITAAPLLFENAFIKGTTEKVNTNTLSLYGVTIGKIKIVSGHIIACDPMHTDEYGIPFTQLFPAGEFPVQLSIAKLKNDESIAFARIIFSDEPVTRWEFALQKNQAQLPVGGEEIHGYSVDAGVGMFIDEEANKVLDKSTVANMNALVFGEMKNHYHNGWKYTMHNFGNYNLAAFSTGLGDGTYATYIGFEAAGKPCRLLTDFDLFNWKRK